MADAILDSTYDYFPNKTYDDLIGPFYEFLNVERK